MVSARDVLTHHFMLNSPSIARIHDSISLTTYSTKVMLAPCMPKERLASKLFWYWTASSRSMIAFHGYLAESFMLAVNCGSTFDNNKHLLSRLVKETNILNETLK